MADAISQALLFYAALGLCVAVPFVLVGMDRIDPTAQGAHAARILLLPSLVMLWPVVAVRWVMLALGGR